MKKIKNIFQIIIFLFILIYGYINQDEIVEISKDIINNIEPTSPKNYDIEKNIEVKYNLKEYIDKDIKVVFCPSNNCPKLFVDTFKDAKKFIYCAFYELDNMIIAKTLVNLSKMGINVSLVIDKKYLDEKPLIYLKENSPIPIYSNKGISDKYMHNKFCIIDNQTIITGSANPTDNGFYKNNNNILRIDSKYLSENYRNEFLQLESGKYSKSKVSALKYQNITLIYEKNESNESGTLINVTYQINTYFCPIDNCKEALLSTIQKAEKNIYFATFALTHDGLKETLLKKASQGIDIKGVVEKRNINLLGSDVKKLNKTFPIHTDKNKYNLHHKFFIIDNKYVITGSMNPSNNGVNWNDENLIVIKSENLAKKFQNEFFTLY